MPHACLQMMTVDYFMKKYGVSHIDVLKVCGGGRESCSGARQDGQGPIPFLSGSLLRCEEYL